MADHRNLEDAAEVMVTWTIERPKLGARKVGNALSIGSSSGAALSLIKSVCVSTTSQSGAWYSNGVTFRGVMGTERPYWFSKQKLQLD
jgi:hypothetical protein